MGIISIVLACLSGLTNLWGTLTSIGFLMMSQMTLPPMPVPPTPANVSPGKVHVGGVAMSGNNFQNGLADPQKLIVLNAMFAGRSLEPERQRQADLLLQAAGQTMFPSMQQPGGIAKQIRDNITERGRLPSASNANGPDYFVIGTGRVEIYDDHATFRPDGSTDVVSVTATIPDETASPPPGAPAPGTASPPSLAPSPSPAPAQPPASGTGGFTSSSTVTVTGPGGTSTTTNTTVGPVFAARTIRISKTAAGMSIVLSILSLLLAIFLLICGIMVLRDSPHAPRLHWVYVSIKIPLVIITLAATSTMINQVMASMASISPVPSQTPLVARNMFTFVAIIGGALALAYPVALIFILRSRTVRAYYGVERGG
jgi:hypothetical protein